MVEENVASCFKEASMKDSLIPKVTSKWRHKNGNIYTVLLVTNLAAQIDEYPVTVVYCDERLNFWSRPLSHWHGSMTLIQEDFQP